MNTKLITAIRTAAKALEDGTVHYDWEHCHSCNCGVVVCAALGISQYELQGRLPDALDGHYSTWTERAGQYCPITGIPENELFRELFSLGLTVKEIVHLERLSNPDIIQRMEDRQYEPKGFFNREPTWVIDHENKRDLISYLRAWASLLVEQGSLDTPERSVSSAPIKVG